MRIGGGDRSPHRLAVAVTAVLVALSPVPAGIARADGPDPPAPAPAPAPAATGSTPDELGDMVLDVIESGGGPTAPTTTATAAPHGH